MNLKKAIEMCIGLIIIGLGLYFKNWMGCLGLWPFLLQALDWFHGLFTHHEMKLQ